MTGRYGESSLAGMGTYADLSIMWNGMSAMLPKPCCEVGFGY